jgi:hypothetical protein
MVCFASFTQSKSCKAKHDAKHFGVRLGRDASQNAKQIARHNGGDAGQGVGRGRRPACGPPGATSAGHRGPFVPLGQRDGVRAEGFPAASDAASSRSTMKQLRCENFYEESAVKSKLPFFLLSSCVRTLIASRQEGPSCLSGCARFGRRSPCLQNAPPCSGQPRPGSLTDARCDALRKRPTATLLDWRLPVSGPRPQGLKAVRAMPATDFYPCRLTSLPRRGAGRSTTCCIRPRAIRRSLVPGRPFGPAVSVRPTHLRYGRPDQSSARRCRRFP